MSEAVTFRWDAAHNPPATQATLDSPGSPPLRLAELSGSQVFARRAGSIVHSLDAKLTLNGRTLGSSLSAQTVGFDATYPSWLFDEDAECRLQGAAQFYVVEFPFEPVNWSPALAVAQLSVIVGKGETWRLKWPNLPLLEFSRAASTHSFARPIGLAGPWLFIYDSIAFVGCNGPPPRLRLSVDFA